MNKLLCALGLSVSTGFLGISAAAAAETHTLTLTWAPSPPPVTGYEVYYGSTASPQAMRALFVPQTLDMKAPAVQYDLLRDLQLVPGQSACFRVKAYNNTDKSDFSNAVCAEWLAEAEEPKEEKPKAEKPKPKKTKKAKDQKAKKWKAKRQNAIRETIFRLIGTSMTPAPSAP